MPLSRVKRTLPFNFGIKDSKDDKKFFISQLTQAENANFVESDSIQMTEGFGFVENFTEEGIIAIKRVGRRVFAFSPKKVYAIEPDYSLTALGSYLNADITNETAYQAHTDALNPDLSIVGTKAHMVFQQENQIYHTIFDIDGRFVSQPPRVISELTVGGLDPRIVPVLGSNYILYLSQSKNNLYLYDEANDVRTLVLTSSGQITAFDVRVSSGVLTIDYQVTNIGDVITHRTFQYSVSRSTVISGSDVLNTSVTNYRNIKGLNVVNNITLQRLNRWCDFTFSGEDYSVFWNNFRGYFVLDSQGNQVGKFLGKIAPPINKDGVSFKGVPQIIENDETFSVFIPALKQSLQVQQDEDTITNPLGLELIRIEINKKRFISKAVGTKNITAISGGIINQVDSNRLVELGFSEDPEIESLYAEETRTAILTVNNVEATETTGQANRSLTVNIASNEIGPRGLKVPKQIDSKHTLTTLEKFGSSGVLSQDSTASIATAGEVIDTALNDSEYFNLRETPSGYVVSVRNRSDNTLVRSINLQSGITYTSVAATEEAVFVTGFIGNVHKVYKYVLPAGGFDSEHTLSGEKVAATDGDFLYLIGTSIVSGSNTIEKLGLDFSDVDGGDTDFTSSIVLKAASLTVHAGNFYFLNTTRYAPAVPAVRRVSSGYLLDNGDDLLRRVDVNADGSFSIDHQSDEVELNDNFFQNGIIKISSTKGFMLTGNSNGRNLRGFDISASGVISFNSSNVELQDDNWSGIFLISETKGYLIRDVFQNNVFSHSVLRRFTVDLSLELITIDSTSNDITLTSSDGSIKAGIKTSDNRGYLVDQTNRVLRRFTISGDSLSVDSASSNVDLPSETSSRSVDTIFLTANSKGFIGNTYFDSDAFNTVNDFYRFSVSSNGSITFDGTGTIQNTVGANNSFFGFVATDDEVVTPEVPAVPVSYDGVYKVSSSGALTEETFPSNTNARALGIGSHETVLSIFNAPASGQSTSTLFFYDIPPHPNIRIGISSRTTIPPNRTDFTNLRLVKGSTEVFDQAISNSSPTSTTSGSERFYEFPLTADLEEAAYSLDFTFSEALPSRWLTGELTHSFVFQDENFTIKKMEAFQSGNKIHLNVTFSAVPAGALGFHIQLSQVGSANPSDFVYSSNVGSVFTFVSEDVAATVGFVSGQDETFSFEVKSGRNPGDIQISTEDQIVTYFAVYKWSDVNGKTQYSKISNLVTVTISAAKIGEGENPVSIPLRFTYLNMTNKNNVIVQVYRSTFIAATLSTSTFKKVGEVNNIKDGDKRVFIDSLQESDLKERFFLFGRDQTNAGSIMIEHQNRIIIANGENIYFSEKPVFEREEAISFKIDSVQILSSDIQSLASLDGNIIAITEQGIFTMFIPDVGTPIVTKVQSLENFRINKNSIVSFQHGLIFQTNYGIALLDRGLRLTYIGDDIKKHLGEHDVVESYVNEPRQEVILRLSDGTLNLVFNYLYKKWTTQEISIISELQTAKGEMLRLDRSSRLLSNKMGEKQSVTSVITTGDVDISGMIQGFNRLLSLSFLGQWRNFEYIRVEIAKDHLSSFEGMVEITPDANNELLGTEGVQIGGDIPLAMDSPLSTSFEVPMRLGRMSSFRFRFTIRSTRPSKLSAVGVLGLSDSAKFFKESKKFSIGRAS